ncbi:MAG: translocation/assembly module TamB domain-containing protein [Saprospiraceae bacterium]|nr:translocation/assembly module TamB domain-containing protein [Saprospiraceae bacterium]
MLALLLKTSVVQNYAKEKLLNYVNKQFNQDIQINSFYLDPFKGFTGSILIRDHHTDTLFYTNHMEIGFARSLWSLYYKNLQLQNLEIDSSVFHIIQYENESITNLEQFINNFKSKDSISSAKFNFKFDKLIFSKSSIRFIIPNTELNINFNSLNLAVDSINTDINYFKVRKLLVDRPTVNIIISKDNNITSTKDQQGLDTCAMGYGLLVDFINFNNATLNYTSIDSGNTDNFYLENINFTLKSFFQSSDMSQLDFMHFNAKGSNGFSLKNALITNFRLDKNKATLEQLFIETPISKLKIELQADFSHDDNYQIDYLNSYYNLKLEEGIFNPLDLVSLFPKFNIEKYVNLKKDVVLNLKGEISGKVNSIKAKNINLNYGNHLTFNGNVNLRNITSKGKELINLNIAQLQSQASFIRSLFPNYKIPDTYDRFGTIRMNGQFDGYLNDFVAFGTFKTDLGIVQSDIKVRLLKNEKTATYSGIFKAIQLDLGKLINNQDFGIINLNTQILNGSGLSRDNVFANVNGQLFSFEYKKYVYKDISIIGNLNKDLFKGDISISDENIKLDLHGTAIRDKNQIALNINSRIQHINFFKLNLTSDTISYAGDLSCQFLGDFSKDFNGFIEVNNSRLEVHNQAFALKKIRLELSSINGLNAAKFVSDVADFQLGGLYNLSSLPQDVYSFLCVKYPEIQHTLNLKFNKSYHATKASGNIFIRDGEKLSQILAFPVVFKFMDVDFNIDTRSEIVELKSNRFDLEFQSFFASKFSFSILSSKDLKILVTTDFIKTSEKIVIGNFKFTTNFETNEGTSSIQIFDSTNTNILVNANLKSSLKNQEFSLNFINKDLFFNNQRWLINEKNKFIKGRDYFSISQMELTDSSHYISIHDIDQKGISLKTDGFDISFVNQFIRNKAIGFSGLFSLEVEIPDLKKFDGLNGNIEVFQLHFSKDNFGPFRLGFSVPDANKPWNLKIENIFQEHVISGSGTFNIPLGKGDYKYKAYDFGLDLSVKAFPFKFLENFISSISNTEGGGDGNLKFYSRDHKLYLTGKLISQKAKTSINYLGIPINFDKQPIRFEENEILFESLQLKDKFDNPISLNGKLIHDHFNDFEVVANLTAPKALILDTKKGENLFYYGYGFGSVDVDFTGPLSALDMNVRVTSLRGTKISIPVQSDQVVNESKFVKFNSKLNSIDTVKSPLHTSILGMNLNMQITMTDEAETAIVFDELTGDILKGSGRGNLLIKSLRNGVFTVNGTYEIEKGEYLFTLYNFVNKPFTIKRGGTITWTGDPLNANINLEAIYEGLYAPPYLLVQEYIENGDEVVKTEAKRRTNVKLIMLLTGSLLKPDIKFDIELPELTGTLKGFADSKIQSLRSNQDQLNQQVFGLLVLRTFLNNNSFDGGINLSATTINTMSEMLANQFSLFVSSLLSNAFGDVDFISGVDFNIGYDLDNASIGDTKQSTKLNEGEVVFSLKHRLWNDQWVVTLGGNYKSKSAIYGNSYFNPESVIEWNTPVPGLKLRIYYRGDESIEGVKHKIGTGVNYRKEFDSFYDFNKELKNQAKK